MLQFQIFKKKQAGSASIVAITTMLLLASMVSVYVMVSGSGLSRIAGFGYGEHALAQAAAEAGIRYVWTNAIQNTNQTTRSWNTAALSTDTIALDDSDTNSPTFQVSITPITKDLPTDVTASDSYYNVTSIGKYGKSQSVMQAYLLIPAVTASPLLTTLVSNGDYSGQAWTVTATSARAPSNAAYYQVLFNQQVSARTGFTLNYKINLVSTTSGHDSDTGYGIYYLANGNPNNMSAYVLQYDPGLTPDQILVKKVVMSKYSTTTPWSNEIYNETSVTAYGGNYNNQSWQKTNAKASWDNSTKKWTNTETAIHEQPSPLSSFISLDNEKSDTQYQQDIMMVPMSTVMNQLNKIKANDTDDNHMLQQDHILTIDVRPDSSSGKVVHRIYIDGLEILRFVDRSATDNFAASPGIGRTGLRVWQSMAVFSNLISPGSSSPIILRSWDIPR